MGYIDIIHPLNISHSDPINREDSSEISVG